MGAARPDHPDLAAAAETISSGTSVNWEQVQPRVTGEEDTALLQALRVIEQIARFHGSPEPTEPDTVVLSSGGGTPGGSSGQTWGQFTLVERLGAGGFGDVYRAHDTKLDREVALKLLRFRRTDSASPASHALQAARLLARIRHPHVVTVYGADELDDRVGIWIVRGRTLEDLLRAQGPLGAREAALVGLDLCAALAAVHGAGLVHGDVKAHNVMREGGGRTLLMDFGAGKDLRPDVAGHAEDLAGTLLYLAPEVFAGEPRTPATDVYALGVLLYHLVSRDYPVQGSTIAAIVEAHRSGMRRHLRDARPDLRELFVRVVERAVAPDPHDRFATAGRRCGRMLGAPDEPDVRQYG